MPLRKVRNQESAESGKKTPENNADPRNKGKETVTDQDQNNEKTKKNYDEA